jgi:cholesterol oxidase
MRNLAVPLVSLQGGGWQRFGRFVIEGMKRPYDFLKARFLPDWARDSTILLIMQTAENRMRLKRGRSIFTLFRQGLVSERDDSLPIPAVIDAGRAVANRFAEKINGIPQSTMNEVLLETPSTAHILGGCGIAANEAQGVIDTKHEVFNYPGLFVADGSVIPANLGVNPSLTITAMTERAMSFVPKADEAKLIRPLVNPGYIPEERKENGRRQRIFAWAGLAALGGLALFGLWKKR